MDLMDYARRDSAYWLKWLVSFYGQKLDTLKRKETDQLADEIRRFCNVYSSPIATDISVSLVRKHLKRLHDQLVEMFSALIPVPSKAWEKPQGRIGIASWDGPSVTVRVSLFRKHLLKRTAPEESEQNKGNLSWAEQQVLNAHAKWEKEALSFIDGSISGTFSAKWPHIFWLALSEVLKENGHRLWRCIECGKVFIKRKRQAYCSPRCSQTMRSDRWYKRNRLKAQKNRREAFKRKKREETGFFNLRVGRSDQKPKR